MGRLGHTGLLGQMARWAAVAAVAAGVLLGGAREAKAWGGVTAHSSSHTATYYLGDTPQLWWTFDNSASGASYKRWTLDTGTRAWTDSGITWNNKDSDDLQYWYTTGIKLTQTGNWYYSLWLGWGSSVGDNGRYYHYNNGVKDTGSYSQFVSSTIDVQGLTAPSSVSATPAGTTSVTLSWTKGKRGAGDLNTLVFRSESATPPTLTQGYNYHSGYYPAGYPFVCSGSDTSWTDSGLTPGTTYYYYFYAVNNDCYSEVATASATTPNVIKVTGLDEDQMLVSWADMSAGTNAYELAIGTSSSTLTSGSTPKYIAESFASTPSGDWTKHSSATYNTGSLGGDAGYVNLAGQGYWLMTPRVYGTPNYMRVNCRVSSSSSLRQLKVQYKTDSMDSFEDGAIWYLNGASAAATNVFHIPDSIQNAQWVQFKLLNESSANYQTIYIMDVRIGSVPDVERSSLSPDTSYYMQVRNIPSATWSGMLTAKTGVLPGTVTSSANSSSATFNWPGNANASGYRIQATKTESAARADNDCPSSLTLNPSATGSVWYYTGVNSAVTCTSTNTSTKSAPAWNGSYGHILAGAPGMAIVSPDITIGAATGMQLSFDVGAWNLDGSKMKLEMGRVDAYYKVDSGPWCFLGSGVPTAYASDGNYQDMDLDVPQGALDGETITFKIVAQHGETGTLLRGPVIRNLKVKFTSLGQGDYTSPVVDEIVSSGTSKSKTVSASEGETVYFRVQALQNNGDVKSVWVEKSQAVEAAKIDQTAALTLTPATTTYAGSDITLTGGGGNGSGSFTYVLKSAPSGAPSGSSVSGDGATCTLHPTKAGTYTITVTKAGDSTYNAKTQDVTVTVNKGTQTITGLSDVTKTYGNAAFSLGASAAGAVSYESSDTDVATISGSTVTIAGAGTSTITATAAETDLYYAATATATLTVNKAAQTLSFAASTATLGADASSVTVTATAAHESPTITYTSGAAAVAGVTSAGGVVTRGSTGYGSVTITATAAETANYGSATATCTVKVMAARPTASGGLTAATLSDTSFSATITKGSDWSYSLLLAREGDDAPGSPTDGTGVAEITSSEKNVSWSTSSGAVVYPAGSTTRAVVHSKAGSATWTIADANPATKYRLVLYGRKPGTTTSHTYDVYTADSWSATVWTLSTEPTKGSLGVEVTSGSVTSRRAGLTVTAGNGARTVVIVTPTSGTIGAPSDGETYTANAVYGSGSDVEDGYVVYDGTDASATFTVSQLTPNTPYTVRAYTYALGSDSATANYLTDSYAEATFTTESSSGPTVNVTGVDTDGFTLNWSNKGEGATYHVDVATDSEFTTPAWAPIFLSFSNWTAQANNSQTTPLEVEGLSFTWQTARAVYNHGTYGKMVWLEYRYAYFQIETPMPGQVTKVTYDIIPGAESSYENRVVKLYAVASDGTETELKSSAPTGAGRNGQVYEATTPLAAGTRLKWSLPNGYSALIDNIRIEMAVPGHQQVVKGLSDDTQYYAQVYKTPDGDPTPIAVKTGVKPGDASATAATRNSVTFGWGAADTGVTGYRVDATTVAASSWSDTCTPTSGTDAEKTLEVGTFKTGRNWKYLDVTETGSGDITSAPVYKTSDVAGQFLVGKPGMGIESASFDIKGATSVKLSYTLIPWNLTIGGASIENGRIDAYYKLDSGEWNYLGTAVPAGTAPANTKQVEYTLTKGQLDGTRVAFKIVLPNGVKGGTGGAYMAGACIQALKAESVTLGSGDYTTHVTGYPKTIAGTSTLSETVTGLAADTDVHFRVQALQGASVKSVWVEATGTTTGFSGPATVTASGETRNGMTLAWDAVSGAASYVVQYTTCSSGGGSDTLVSTCPNGTTSNRNLLATSPQAGAWSWQRPSGELWPEWDNGYGNFSVLGHNLMSSVAYGSTPSPKPALVSPILDLSGYTGGYVSFSHGSRHNGYKDPYSKVTLYWCYSTDGGTTWTSWTAAGTSRAASGATWTSGVTLEIPSAATGSGKTKVRLKLQADSAATEEYNSKNVFTGPMLKDVAVYGTGRTGDYSAGCSTKSAEIPVAGTSYTMEGLSAKTTYYFRVLAVGSGDGARSSWTEGQGTTTAFEGPENAAVTGTTRYTLTAGWDEYTESGYTTTYKVQLTGCANAGADETTVATCPASTLDAGSSASAWTYQRSYSGSTAGAYPKYESSVHKLWGQWGTVTTQPGILSPVLDLGSYASASVEFTHLYVNKSEWSEVKVSYSLDGGETWSDFDGGTTGVAAGYTLATGSSRKIALPAAAMTDGVKIRVQTTQAHAYSPNGTWEPGDILVAGASIAGLKVTARGYGGGDFDTAGCASDVYETGSTSLTFDGTLLAGDSHVTGLEAGHHYYVRVATVLTKSGESPAQSAWSEADGTTLEPMPPPEEVWAENVRQAHLTVAWSEAPGADGDTLYKYEVSSCPGGTETVVAAAEARTDGDLDAEVDDWSYVGGGSEPEEGQQTAYEFLRETYPAWAKKTENSIALAGTGEPGIESAEFSTVGASAGSITFLHGRWYSGSSIGMAAVTASYSIDGGDSWTEIGVTPTSDIKGGDCDIKRSFPLPTGALGHAHVKVRLEAKSAGILQLAKSSSDSTLVDKPVGAAVKEAKVTLTKQGGAYTDGLCVVKSGSGLTAEQLSVELGDSEALAAGTTYYFRVAASDGKTSPAQYGAWVESSAKTPAVPDRPGSAWVVPTSIGRHSMTVQWEAVAEAESYVLKVYDGSSAGGTLLQTIETTATTVPVSGLATPDHDYYFTVQSVADGCSSATTRDTTGHTSTALAVTGFCVTNILDTSLTVKWDEVADTAYTLEAGPMTTNGATGALYETIECPATTLARSDKGNGWFYLGGNANYPKYYANSDSDKRVEDQGHVLSYSSAGTPGIQSRWFSTFGAKSATVEFLHGRWYNNGANSALQVYYTIDGGTTWTLAGDIAAVPGNSVPGGTLGGEKTWTRFALPERALGQRTVAIRVQAPDAAAGGSYGYGAEIKDLRIKLEAYPQSASTFSGDVSENGGSLDLTGLTVGQRYWFRLTASESFGGATYTADAIQTAATRKKTTGVVQSQGFEGPGTGEPDGSGWHTRGALDTVPWKFAIKYFTVGNSASDATAKAWASGYPVVEVADGENPLYGDRSLRMSGSSAAAVYGVVEFQNKDFGVGHEENVAVTIPFAACDLADGENLWVCYSTDGGSTWTAPDGLATLTKSGMTLGKIGRGGSDAPNQNWPYNRGSNTVTRPAGDAYMFEVHGIRQIAVRVAFCGNSGGAKHYYYIDGVTLERLATPPTDVTASANTHGTVELGWTPAAGQSVVIIRGQDKREAPASLDLDSLPHGYEVVTNATGGNYWVNTADPGVHATATDPGVTGGWKYFYYFYGALDNGDGTYTLSKECVQREVIVRGMVEAIASQGWDGWDVHPWGYKKGRTTNPGRAGDCGYWAYNQSGDTLPYEWAHFVEGSWEHDGDARGAQGAKTYAYYYGADKTYGPAGRTDPDSTNQLGVSSYTNSFGTNCFRLSGGSGWTWSGTHTYTNNNNNVRTVTDPYINTNNAAIQFDTVDLSGYKNVQFSFHYAQTYSGGGNYMHVAISTNGNGENGSWMAYDNKNDAGWRQVDASRDYGLQLQTMTEKQTGGNVDFYDESRAPYGNPFVLNVPDSVTQMTVRLTFFDTTGHDQRNALVFVDEVRLTGEVAIEAPKPYISEIGKDRFTVHWQPVADADTYDVEVTEVCDEDKIKLAQAFVVADCPKDWEASSSGATFTKTASRLYSDVSGTAHDHGLNLSGGSGALTSPEVGGTTNLQFYAKAYNASGSAKLIVEAKGDKDTKWEEIGSWTAEQLTGSWKGYTNSLPNRQWTQVRFRREGGSGTSDSIYVDDIEFHGEGVYTVAGVKSFTGVTATNQVVTGLTSGKRYLAHVRAVGSPAGVVVRSAWGETADWTAGDFAVAADGFEMTRSTWGNPGSGIAVIAVNEGKAYSDVPAPTGTPAVGSAVGQGVVIAQTTSAQAAPGLEHVVPYGSRTEPVEAKYVVYWKHGSYWEGRLETNAVLGTYVCSAADALAYTNGVAVAGSAAVDSDTAYAGGKGWTGPWKLSVRHGESWNNAIIDKNSSGAEGLIETNQIQGAGGNMIKLMPGGSANSKQVALKRQLAADLSAGSDWWGMFTMKVTHPHDHSWAGIRLLGAGSAEQASVGNVWNNNSSSQSAAGISDTVSSYEISADGTYIYVFKWDAGQKKMYLHVQYVSGTSSPVWDPSDATTLTLPNSWTWDVNGKIITGMTDIRYIELVAQNFSGSDEYVGDVWFDEIRIGESWADIIGKETEAPFPVTGAEAWTDGNELVRVSWTYADEGTDNSVTPAVERPLADGVRVYQSEDAGTTWTQIYQGKGTNTAAVAAGGISRWDHVVAPGSTHRYKVEAYAAGKTAAAVNAALKGSSPATYDVTTGTYGATEYVNPFSYTNWSVASTASGMQWLGGNGFGDNYWAPGSGSAGTWSIATPEEAQAAVHITNVVKGARLSAGNVLKATVGNGETASINRTLAGSAWCGNVGETFYVAFRMAYQYSGDKKEAGLRLTDANGAHVQVGKPYATGNSDYYSAFGVTATSFSGGDESSGWMEDNGAVVQNSLAPFESNADNAYLVVLKVYWSAKDGTSGKVNLRAWKYQIPASGVELPTEEPSTAHASYDNGRLGAIRKIEFIAGSRDGGNTLGSAYFDEVRFGTSWEDVVGAKEPDDVWVAGESATVYLGDFRSWTMTSVPHGPKQTAWVSLTSGGTTFPAASTATADTTWLRKEVDGTSGKTNSVWQGQDLQFTVVGTMYGGGSVRGELVTKNSWEREVNEYKWNTYTVTRLPAPSAAATNGAASIGLGWEPATENGRTFDEVMVVRVPAGGSWTPVQGRTYLKGDTVGSSGKVLYRGTAENALTDKGLSAEATTYRYLFFTVNNSYYSDATMVDAGTTGETPPVVIDGDPIDWVGTPSDVKNSATVSSSEWIWTDKVEEGRVDTAAAYDADLKEFRIKVGKTSGTPAASDGFVYFLARLNCLTNAQNPYISVGIATNVDASPTALAAEGNTAGDNWLGDEGDAFLGGNLFAPAALHYADIQMAVHQVGGVWKIELWRKDGSGWYSPAGEGTEWQVASSAAGAADPCIEWKIKRSALGLDYAAMTPARISVMSFANANGWNNDVIGTTALSDGTTHAVDALTIAPWGQNDKDLALSSWDEGLKSKVDDYWFDLWFGPTAVHNGSPAAPAHCWLNDDTAHQDTQDQEVNASPVMHWTPAVDQAGTAQQGFIAGYLLEVTTNQYFNGKEGTTENGPVSLRVNLKASAVTTYELTADTAFAAGKTYYALTDGEYVPRAGEEGNPAALGLHEATDARYQYVTDSREYWWRVRARDNSGALSPATAWHYTVLGKTDNQGPVAKLLYVGTEVTKFLNNTDGYRDDQERSGDATSVLDSELEAGGQSFGFVIEWYDVNGVYATNHIRDGVSGAGGFAWNILAEHGDGTPYGRVSPNWDLIIVDRSTASAEDPGEDQPDKPAAETVGSETHEYKWAEDGLTLPTDDGGEETVYCWYIDCGKDTAFRNDQTRNTGNNGQYLTNYVTGAFSIGTYRTDLDIYLTVSAEDGCTNGAYRSTSWYDWPMEAGNKSQGSWAAGPQEGISSGYCADGPNPSRNVTTNQLLHIHVRDNDITAPVASTARWGGDATDASGTKLYPMAVVATNAAADGAPASLAWASIPGRLPTPEGQRQALAYQLTDGDVANDGTYLGAAKNLTFYMNVYDAYIHSGMKTGSAETESVTKSSPAVTRTLTNSAFIVKSLSGGEWTDAKNWANYLPGWSALTKTANTDAAGSKSDTVLAWAFGMTEANVKSLLGHSDPLGALGTGTDAGGDPVVISNSIRMDAWDADNNAWYDQENAELTLGQLMFTDDDATAPEAVGFTSAGTGTNFTHFGQLARWRWGEGNTAAVSTNPLMDAIVMSAEVTGKQSGTGSPDSDTTLTLKWNKSAHTIYHDAGGMGGTAYRSTAAKYFQFQMGGNGNTTWRSDMIGFHNRVSPTGPTMFALTVQGDAGTAYPAVISRNWKSDGAVWTHENCTLATDKVGYNAANSRDNVVKLDSVDSATTATLTSPAINCQQLSTLRVEFSAGRAGNKNASLSLAVECSVDGGTFAPLASYTYPHTYSEWATTAAKNGEDGKQGWVDVSFDLFGEVDNLRGQNKTVQVRFKATGLTGSYGFRVADPKLVAGSLDSSERLLGVIEIEKNIAASDSAATEGAAAETAGSYANTDTDVILGFDGIVEGSTDGVQTFRLYGYKATSLDAETGEISASGTGTWGIKDLYIHGTASEPKHSEVTDYDVAEGAWTNRLEVMDGAESGYDTVKSGLWVKDDGVEGRTQQVPSYTIKYPSYYDGTTTEKAVPNGSADGVVVEDDLILRSVAAATFDSLPGGDFDSADGWTLSEDEGTAISGGRLTLPGNATVSSASRSLTPLSASSTPVESVTIAGTVRVKGSLTAEHDGVNLITVTAMPYNGDTALLEADKILTTNITANASWKNYAVGPWSLELTTVTRVDFTVKQTGADSTEMLVDTFDMRVAQWGADIAADEGAWATTVTNGMEAAKVLVRTPEMSLATTPMPLSKKSGSEYPQNQYYTLEATVHDYDHDRSGDSLADSKATTFWLYDDDEVAPQAGAKFGGPLGVFAGGTILPQSWRAGSGNDQRWPITDAELAAMGPTETLTFALSFYDYSGWYTKSLALGTDTILADGAVPAAAAAVSGGVTWGWTLTQGEGAEDSPSATNSLTITAKGMFDKYNDAFNRATAPDADTDKVAMVAEIWDNDADRADDALYANQRVGYVWFTDQDASAPTWGGQTAPYYGVVVATNVAADGKAALTNTVDVTLDRYALMRKGDGSAATLADHQGNTSGAMPADRTFALYDGELHAVDADHQLVVLANLNDPLPGYNGMQVSGLQRGSSLTETRALWGGTAYEETYTITNSHVVFETAGGEDSLTNAAYATAFSEAVSKTRVTSQAGHTGWAWGTFPTNDIGKLLPSTETSADLRLAVWAYDSDTNRPCDQAGGRLAGPVIRLRDDDTTPPGAPGEVTLTGLTLPAAGEELTRLNAPWTNNLGGVKMSFAKATDALGTTPDANGLRDIKAAGIARYRLAEPGATPGIGEGDVVVEVSGDEPETHSNISVPVLTADKQGFGAYQLFAVDADADRPGDALAGPATPVPLAYDCTKPTAVKFGTQSDGSDAHSAGADTDEVDDPTTQFKLTWYTTDVGPDDPVGDKTNYDSIPSSYKSAAGATRYNVLSPWETYKVYYKEYDHQDVLARKGAEETPEHYIWTAILEQGAAVTAANGWTNVVTKDTTIADPTAGGTTENPAKYTTLGTLGTGTATLYDLDYDSEYIVVIRGVDQAGNEGPIGQYSWATNNTIKFAVTQGVVKATAAIDTMVTAAGAASQIKHPDLSETAPQRGAVLYWKASENKTTHVVNKEYDLIYRDAASFTENGNESWNMAASGSGAYANSGSSKANWNYQADEWLSTPNNRLRFYRASYHNRWQDTKPGTQEAQYPLASEEVYSMNNVVLSEGFNYVSLQGVPWTNTFRGVFGADDKETWPETEGWRQSAEQTWPGGENAADITNGATVVQFYTPGTAGHVGAGEWYFYGKDGRWYNSNGDDVTDDDQTGDFFARPFSLTLPESNEDTDAAWWTAHKEFVVTNGVKERKAMLWHPIMQVPTNGVPADATASTSSAKPGARDGTAAKRVYKQSVTRGKGVYNLLSLNLPVAVHPSKLGLVEMVETVEETGENKVTNYVPTTVAADMKMRTGSAWEADKLYVVDTATKEVRGNSTMYCDANGDWRYNSNRAKVTGAVIKPNDMIVLISGEKEPGAGDTWDWTYSPEDFYQPPTRHMGREHLQEP